MPGRREVVDDLRGRSGDQRAHVGLERRVRARTRSGSRPRRGCCRRRGGWCTCSPCAVSPRMTRIPAAGSAVASSVMNGGMPVSSLLARSPGPCQTNQPSPIAGMIAATTASPTSSTSWPSRRERRRIVIRPWAPSIAASTKHPWSTTTITAMPGRTEPPGSGSGITESAAAVMRRDGGDQPRHQDRDPGRPRHQGQGRQHDQQRAEPPRPAEVGARTGRAGSRSASATGRAGGRSPSATATTRRAGSPATTTGESSTGGTPRVTAGGPHTCDRGGGCG